MLQCNSAKNDIFNRRKDQLISRHNLAAEHIFFQSGGQDQERKHKKRRGEFYSIQTSLIVAALKKMLPIGLNMCTPGDQELISLAKTRYLLVRQLSCDMHWSHI